MASVVPLALALALALALPTHILLVQAHALDANEAVCQTPASCEVQSMKAIYRSVYGSPDVLTLKNLPKPAPRADQVLIRVHATSINSGDWRLLKADPWLIRLAFGFFWPSIRILGGDISGVVEELGSNVTQFKLGDEVYADLATQKFGGFAEYVCVSESAPIALKPKHVSHEQAAAVPVAAVTALQGLRDYGHVKAGDEVLIVGAASGVGSFAVQIAKSFGARVTAVCSPSKMDMVRSLIGADSVSTFEELPPTKRFNVILNMAAYKPASDYLPFLVAGGTYIIGGGSLYETLKAVFKINSGVVNYLARPNKRDLQYVTDLIETNQVIPCVDKVYSLAETPEAIRYVMDRYVQGKVVVRVV